MFKISPFLKQCFVTAAVDLTTVGSGSSLGFPAILLPQLREPLSTIKLTKESESWIASVSALGMLFGYFLTPTIMERLGRKKTHYFVTVLSIIGWFITIMATDVKALISASVFHGIASGVLTTLSTVLVGECTSPKNRGAFLTTLTLSQSTGVLISHALGSLLSWQHTATVCVFFPFTSLIMSIFTPESPSWLLSKGRYDKFEKVFRWYRGDFEEEELNSMLADKSGTKSGELKITDTRNRFLDNFKAVIVKKEFYKPIIIMVHSNNLLQFAGGSIMVAYSTTLVSLLMGPTVNIYLWTVFMDVWRIFSNTVAVFVIHRVKRRTMIFSCGALCVFCHVVIACYLYATSENWLQTSSWVPLLCLSLQLFSNAVGIVPIRNVLAGELFPLKYRSIGGSISFATGSGFMFLVLKTFPLLVDKLKLYGTYTLYGSILLYNLVVIWFLLPETKGRTLLQIEKDFKGKEQCETDAVITT